jgi:hypothetical protein
MNPAPSSNTISKSREHLKASRVGYFKHLYGGVRLGLRMMYLGLTSIFHGIVPAWFEGDAPIGVARLYYRHVHNHPNPVFQLEIGAERESAQTRGAQSEALSPEPGCNQK